MGVHFLSAQGGLGLNPQRLPRKIGPGKGIVNRGQFVNAQTAHLPCTAPAGPGGWFWGGGARLAPLPRGHGQASDSFACSTWPRAWTLGRSDTACHRF